MLSCRRPSRYSFVFLFVSLSLGLLQAKEFKWQEVKIDGREYISAGDIAAFYRFNEMTQSGDKVRFHAETETGSLTMIGRVGSQTLEINLIKFILSYPLARHAGHVVVSKLDLCKLIDPVLRPSTNIKRNIFNTVVIDPGHGGHDSGAYCPLGKECDFALDTAMQLKQELEKRNYKVVMTRSTDRFITLGDRVKFANRYRDAVFVSLHYNSGQSRAEGFETFALSPQGSSSTYTGRRRSDYLNYQGNDTDSENIALSTAIHVAAMHNISRIKDRGIKRARWTVLTGLKIPGVLFEGGFLSNVGESRRIATSSHRGDIAEAIADGLDQYKKSLAKKKKLAKRR